MSEPEDFLVSKADIARLAGVRPPAVSNWVRRHASFPGPVRKAESGLLFSARQVAAWLEARKIPADTREAGESPGATYADRFRTNLGSRAPLAEADPAFGTRLVGRLLGPLADSFRDAMSPAGHLDLLLDLLYLRWCDDARWASLVRAARSAGASTNLGIALHSCVHDLPECESGLEYRGLAEFLRLGDGGRLGPVIDLLDAIAPGEGRRGESNAADVFGLLVQEFAEREGRKGEELVTPPTFVRLMTALLPSPERTSRVYDPYGRTGEFLAALVQKVDGDVSKLLVTAQHPNERVRRLARMNLTMNGVRADMGPGPAFALDEPAHPSRRFDLVIANPPFNLRLPALEARDSTPWRYGPPPESNANFGWLQHVVSSLDAGGRAAVLMGNNATFSANGRERLIRAAMVEDGAVECLVALPAQMFPSTAIPVTLWLLRHPTGTCEEILFVDARDRGAMASRVLRFLPDDDVQAIVTACTTWRNRRDDATPRQRAGLVSRAAPIAEIRARDYSLSPPVYVRAPLEPLDIAVEAGALSGLAGELEQLHSRCRIADARVDRILKEIGVWNR